jgi:hypothetical protein
MFWKKMEREVGKCPNCEAPIHVGYTNTWCPRCSERLPEKIQQELPRLQLILAGLTARAAQSAASIEGDSTAANSAIMALRDRADLLRTYAGFIMFGIIFFALVGILIFINAGYTAQEESSPALQEVRSVADSLGDIRQYLQNTDSGQTQRVLTITSRDKMGEQLNSLDKFDKNVQDGIGRLQADWKDNKITVLVSTVSQRVGIIVLLIFLLQILVPSYRYNIRLAAFYAARADALEILSTVPNNTLDNLIPIFSPDSLDYGRTVPSPTEHVVEMLKEVVKLGRSAADSK